jgi:cytochrome c554/c'-like protein
MKSRCPCATTICLYSLGLCLPLAHCRDNRVSATRMANASAVARTASSKSSLPTKSPATAQSSVETPMATDERLEAPGWWPTKRSTSRADYTGPAECARCHAKKSSTQFTTPMAHASSSGVNSGILREHEQIVLKRGPYRYSVSRTQNGSTYTVTNSNNSISAPLLWAFGLGNKGQTFLYQLDGSFYESRLSFYKSIQSLDLTTGHGAKTPDTLEDALGRLIDPDTLRRCFSCHTTAAVTSEGFDPAHLIPGVTCEACHGPGAKHAALMDEEKNAQGRLAIFNPARLTPIALVDFCGACHRTWNDVYELGTTGVANARFQPYRLENSRCWGDGDARLTCIACHDPHQQLVHEAKAYDEKCLACHVAAAAEKSSPQHPGKACPVGKKECVTCHMPRVLVPVMHAPFTDHRIRIVRAGQPYPD